MARGGIPFDHGAPPAARLEVYEDHTRQILERWEIERDAGED